MNKTPIITMNQGLRIMRKMLDFDDNKKADIIGLRKVIIETGSSLEEQSNILRDINRSVWHEMKNAVKTNPFKPISEQEADTNQFDSTIKGTNFINVAYRTLKFFSDSYINLSNICLDIIPGEIISSSSVYNSEDTRAKSTEDLKNYVYEYQLNEGPIKKYAEAVITLDSCKEFIAKDLENLLYLVSNYYMYLNDRHSIRNVKVHIDALVTDISYAIFDNIDSHGEIQAGTKSDEISAYTLSKGLVVAQAASNQTIIHLISTPNSFINFIEQGINVLLKIVDKAQLLMKKEIDDINNCINTSIYYSLNKTLNNDDSHIKNIYSKFKDVNPASIINKNETFVSQDEKFSRDYEEETIGKIVSYIKSNVSAREVLTYILNRKELLKKHFQEDNTFYVCQISQGNPFLGEAPGGLKVIPGKRPNIEMDNIVGSGFDRVRNFYKSIEEGSKWAPIFIATSPSKSADKSNCLMIGPPGVGKTEIMRAIGGHKDCIGIFAQGSDFLTCWKGEAEKNPKRLFEQALKLHKESKKRVYILIDEIDAVMHKPEGHNDINLSLEFQILMDGIVAYPGISVWGTTNNPERIPMAMIRRFNLVEIVGELSLNDRITLLKHFLGYMPQQDFKEEVWNEAAIELEGATGDVIRQVCDHIWREKIYTFTSKNKDNAEKIMQHLISDNGFDIDNFDNTKRNSFKNELQKYVNVTPSDVKNSIKIHLKNMAIRSEIDTAVHTYKTAKSFVKELEDN